MLILISDAFATNLPEVLAPFGEVTDDKEHVRFASYNVDNIFPET